MLVTDAESGRCKRNLLVHAGSSPLPVECHVRSADKRRNNEIWRRILDFCDRRTKICDVQREEVRLDNGSLALFDIMGDPLCGDLAIIVVSRDGVDLVAPLLHGIVDDRFDGLRWRGAGDDAVAIAYATFIEHVVEIEGVCPAERLPDRLA